MRKYFLIGLIVWFFAYWSGLIGAFVSDYKMYEVRWGAYVSDEAERVKVKDSWITEIIDNRYRWNSLLWVPNSDNTGGFLEISFYEKKEHWWEILN